MIRDENAVLTGYVYLDLNTRDYGGFVSRADKLVREKLQLPAGYSLKWSGENEFELRAKERLKIMLPIVFVTIFLLLYMVFRGGRGLQSSRPSYMPSRFDPSNYSAKGSRCTRCKRRCAAAGGANVIRAS